MLGWKPFVPGRQRNFGRHKRLLFLKKKAIKNTYSIKANYEENHTKIPLKSQLKRFLRLNEESGCVLNMIWEERKNKKIGCGSVCVCEEGGGWEAFLFDPVIGIPRHEISFVSFISCQGKKMSGAKRSYFLKLVTYNYLRYFLTINDWIVIVKFKTPFQETTSQQL